MSRLDGFINRMVSQRACLNHGAALVSGIDGPAFELGLGNGRTYSHMREIMPERDIFVFERSPAAHPQSMPPENRLILGNVDETLPEALARFGDSVVLIHADLGGHDPQKNDAFARLISPLVAPFVAKGGLMISSDKMYFDDFREIDTPPDAVPGRCHIYQRD